MRTNLKEAAKKVKKGFSYLAVLFFSVCSSGCVSIAHWTGLIDDYEYECFCDINRFNDAVSTIDDQLKFSEEWQKAYLDAIKEVRTDKALSLIAEGMMKELKYIREYHYLEYRALAYSTPNKVYFSTDRPTPNDVRFSKARFRGAQVFLFAISRIQSKSELEMIKERWEDFRMVKYVCEKRIEEIAAASHDPGGDAAVSPINGDWEVWLDNWERRMEDGVDRWSVRLKKVRMAK